MLYVFGIVLDAAIFGAILVALTGEFPGWGALIGCVLAVGLAAGVVAAFLAWPVSLVGILAGAAVGAWMIRWITSVEFPRALKAVGIYLGVRLVLTILLVQITR